MYVCRWTAAVRVGASPPAYAWSIMRWPPLAEWASRQSTCAKALSASQGTSQSPRHTLKKKKKGENIGMFFKTWTQSRQAPAGRCVASDHQRRRREIQPPGCRFSSRPRLRLRGSKRPASNKSKGAIKMQGHDTRSKTRRAGRGVRVGPHEALQRSCAKASNIKGFQHTGKQLS